MADETTLTARYVFSVAVQPLERGTVTVRNDRIVAVSPHGERTPDRDLGDAAIVPGFVNAHTHLDLTGAKGRTPPTPDFVGWLRQVIAYRKERTPEQVADDVRTGIVECLRYGTTLVGDIAADGGTWDALAAAPLRAVVFREVLGLPGDRADAAVAAAKLWLQRHPDTPTCRAGLSPHAPYSVGTNLYQRIALLSSEFRRPLATHLAESREELELLERLDGPFVGFLKELGVWSRRQLTRTHLAILDACDQRAPRLFVHCNYLPTTTRLPASGSIVYCPRTHAAFEHPTHPVFIFLSNRQRVGLGTDSLASNPDLSLLAEARTVRGRYSGATGATILRMATLSGAEALGWADECGSLEPGKSADFAVVELPPHDAHDPHDLLFASDRPVRATVFRGELVAGNW